MAIPAILQMLGQSTQLSQTAATPLDKIKQMIKLVKAAGNPQALLEQMAQQRSPQLAQALDLVKQAGGDPKKAFEKLASEQGLDLNDLWSLFL